jgi:adenylosuccinate lyase
VWSKIPPETINMLSKPETYTGAAAAKAREIARSAETYLKAQSSR